MIRAASGGNNRTLYFIFKIKFFAGVTTMKNKKFTFVYIHFTSQSLLGAAACTIIVANNPS